MTTNDRIPCCVPFCRRTASRAKMGPECTEIICGRHFMTQDPSDEILEGYRDGFRDDRDDLPASLANRSHAYRHGWLNGRDDRLGRARQPASATRTDAAIAQMKDRGDL